MQTSSSVGFGLNNSGDVAYLVASDNSTVLAELDFLGNVSSDTSPAVPYNVSITRYPQGNDFWYQHPLAIDPATSDFWQVSPGSAPDFGDF